MAFHVVQEGQRGLLRPPRVTCGAYKTNMTAQISQRLTSFPSLPPVGFRLPPSTPFLYIITPCLLGRGRKSGDPRHAAVDQLCALALSRGGERVPPIFTQPFRTCLGVPANIAQVGAPVVQCKCAFPFWSHAFYWTMRPSSSRCPPLPPCPGSAFAFSVCRLLKASVGTSAASPGEGLLLSLFFRPPLRPQCGE